jgi:hypothetical protein
MVIELYWVSAFRTMLGWRRQMVIDPADYGDTMQLAGEPQKAWRTLRDGCPDPSDSDLEILEGKYPVTMVHNGGGLK